MVIMAELAVDTKEFGKVTVTDNDIISMMSPIFGYEEMMKYIILADEEIGEGIEWFQSTENRDLCFILINPDVFGLIYNPDIPDDLSKLLALDEENTAIRLVAVIPDDDFLKTRVNLKCPIVINTKDKKAAQAFLDAEYPIRYNLFVEDKEGE